jgi:hypothetical protein
VQLGSLFTSIWQVDEHEISITQRVTRVPVTSEDMAGGGGGGEGLNNEMNYVKRKRKNKIIWNRNKDNKLKNEMGYIQSLKEAYNNVRFVISEPNL